MRKSQIMIAKAIISVIIAIILIVAVIYGFFKILNSFTKEIESTEDAINREVHAFADAIFYDFGTCRSRYTSVWWFAYPHDSALKEYLDNGGDPSTVENVNEKMCDSWFISEPSASYPALAANFGFGIVSDDYYGSILFAAKAIGIDERDYAGKYKDTLKNQISADEPFIIGKTLYSQISEKIIPSLIVNEPSEQVFKTKIHYVDFENKKLEEDLLLFDAGPYCGIRIFDSEVQGVWEGRKIDTDSDGADDLTLTCRLLPETYYVSYPLPDYKYADFYEEVVSPENLTGFNPKVDCAGIIPYRFPKYSEFFITKKDTPEIYSCGCDFLSKYLQQQIQLTGEYDLEPEQAEELMYDRYGNLSKIIKINPGGVFSCAVK